MTTIRGAGFPVGAAASLPIKASPLCCGGGGPVRSWTDPTPPVSPRYLLQQNMSVSDKRIVFKYRRVTGRVAFEHIRYPDDTPRGKHYAYRTWPGGVMGGQPDYTKPGDARRLLWLVPELVADRDSPLFWTEGERDAAEFIRLGYRATSHHGGAGMATPEQAGWIGGNVMTDQYRGHVYLVADRSVAGAYDVLKRRSLLLDLGIPASHLTVVRGRSRVPDADFRDHLALGYGVKDLVEPDLDKVRAVADLHPTEIAQHFADEGYDWTPANDDPELDDFDPKTWKPEKVTR